MDAPIPGVNGAVSVHSRGPSWAFFTLSLDYLELLLQCARYAAACSTVLFRDDDKKNPVCVQLDAIKQKP